jgi:hypothetical protein
MCGALVGVASSAGAQPADRKDAIHQAQAKWRTGTRAATRGDYEAARAAFASAYELAEEPVLLFALGDAEVHTAKYLDGARHLAKFLSTNVGTVAQRAAAAKALDQATSHVAKLMILVTTTDAAVQIDGELAGRTPFADPVVYVAPGSHVLRVEKANRLAMTETVDLAPGQSGVVEGELAPILADAGPGTAAEETLQPAVKPAAGTRSLASAAWRTPISDPPASEIDRAVSARTVAIISGSVLTAAALGVGITFFVKRGSAFDERDAANHQIGAGHCSNPGSALAGPCQRLASAANAIADDNYIMNWSFPAAGVLGAATMAAAIFWPRSTESQPELAIGRVNGGAIVTVKSGF